MPEGRRLVEVCEELVDEGMVELDALGIDAAGQGAIGQHPRPRDGEAIVLEAEALGKCHVLLVAVVVVAVTSSSSQL